MSHGRFDLILDADRRPGGALVWATSPTGSGCRRSSATCSPGSWSGPNTPGFVADRHLAEQLAEVGVILLMFGVGLHFHLKELLAVRRVAVPGAVVPEPGRDRRSARWSAAPSAGAGRPGVVFGLAVSVASTVVLIRGAGRQQRPAHADRAHRRRLAGRRGPVHRRRAGAAAGPVRRPGGAGRAGWPLARRAAPGQDRRAGRRHLRGRRAGHPLAARPGGRDAVARAVHPDGAGRRARHRRRVGQAVRRVDGAGGVPGRHGRRPVGVQPAGGDRRAADAGRLRRAVLRLGRACCSTRGFLLAPRAGGGDAGHRHGRQAAGRPRASCCCCATRCGSPWRWPSPWPRSASSRSSWPPPGRSLGVLADAATNALVAAPSSRSRQPAPLPPGRSRSSGSCRRFLKPPRCRRTRRETAGRADGRPERRRPLPGGRRRATGRWAGPSSRLLRENEVEPDVDRDEPGDGAAARREGVRAVYGDAAHRETLERGRRRAAAA